MSHTATDPVVALHLPISQVNIVLQGLAELPLKVAKPVYESVQQQAETELARHRAFLSGQADPVQQQNVKPPAEPGEADTAAS